MDWKVIIFEEESIVCFGIFFFTTQSIGFENKYNVIYYGQIMSNGLKMKVFWVINLNPKVEKKHKCRAFFKNII